MAALRLVAVIQVFWARRTSVTEGLHWVRSALTHAEAAAPVEAGAAQVYLSARAKALSGEASLAFELGDPTIARAAVEASISLAR